MRDIVQELQDMKGDALLIQSGADQYGWASYEEADAIICRTRTEDGYQWSFGTLGCLGQQCVIITREHGTLDDIAKAAYYQFGNSFYTCDRISVTYADIDFPKHLIPDIL